MIGATGESILFDWTVSCAIASIQCSKTTEMSTSILVLLVRFPSLPHQIFSSLRRIKLSLCTGVARVSRAGDERWAMSTSLLSLSPSQLLRESSSHRGAYRTGDASGPGFTKVRVERGSAKNQLERVLNIAGARNTSESSPSWVLGSRFQTGKLAWFLTVPLRFPARALQALHASWA